jgi:acetolactate synthase-1/2/3 large subunit
MKANTEKKGETMRGADLLVRSLIEAGVTRVFSLSGNQIMPIYDACFEHGLTIVHTRHEGAAVYMAEAHAQLTGEVGVALVTAGGGLSNAVGALFSVAESETPLVLLSGDSPISQDGMGAFQEMDQCAITAPVTKLSMRPQRPEDLGDGIARAFRAARSGRPGPVHLALAVDVIEADAATAPVPTKAAMARVPQQLAEGDANLIVQAILAARRPMIITGPALNQTRTGDLTNKLAEALDAPVITMESPRGLKDPALGNISNLFEQADLVVNLGKRVDFTLSFGKSPINPEAKWIIVDASPREQDRAHYNLGSRLKIAVTADPLDAAARLTDTGQAAPHRRNRGEWLAQATKALVARNFTAEQPGSKGKITSAQLCEAVARQLRTASGAIAVCDGGEFGQWAQAIVPTERRIINGVSGVIGGGLCYGIAAALAYPDVPVLSLMGDGTAGFHFGEIETAARNGAACVIVIGNDLRWNAEHQIQLREYGESRVIGCQLSHARYDLACAAFGGHGEYVTELSELAPALSRAVASGKVACVNVMIDGAAAPLPPGH